MKSVILSLLLIVVGVGCARTAPLQMPPPIAATPNWQATEDGILRALGQRGWIVLQRAAGAIDATYNPRGHRLWVRISYDAQAVYIQYLGSEGLAERREGNAIYIHPRANIWLRNLYSDIAGALQFQGPPVYEAPPPGGQLPPPPPPPP